MGILLRHLEGGRGSRIKVFTLQHLLMSVAWLGQWLPISCEPAGFTFGWVKVATFPIIWRNPEIMTFDCKHAEGLCLGKVPIFSYKNQVCRKNRNLIAPFSLYLSRMKKDLVLASWRLHPNWHLQS